jgi:hypothetical protein
MNLVRSSILLMLIMLLVACGAREAPLTEPPGQQADDLIAQIQSPPWPTAKVPVEDDAPGHPLSLADGKRRALERQALAGDEGSALKLFRYYARLSPPDLAGRDRWLEVAAENGDVSAMGMRAGVLAQAGGEDNCLRAKFWEERALRAGVATDGYVETPLANLVGLAETWQQCVDRGAAR